MSGKHFNLTLDRSDVKSLNRALDGIKDGAPKALRGAVNKTLKGVVTDWSREVGSIINLPQKRIKKDIRIAKKASLHDVSGRVTTSGKPVNLIEFQATQLKKGVKVRVLKGGARELIEGAFMATVSDPDGGVHKLVFWRKKTSDNASYIGTKKRKPWREYGALPREYRLPIQAKWGPRIQDYAGRDDVLQNVEGKGRDRLKKELASQTDRLLQRQKGK